MKNKTPMPYFSYRIIEEEKRADFYVFGDIASRQRGLAGLLQPSSDQSSYDMAKELSKIPEDYEVVVHVNSNGGELKEGLGIYNTLKSRDKVTTICEGFAASAGSLIFCAGQKRIMQPASLLFIHQASMYAEGNSDDFAKVSEDLRIVTEAAVAAYREAGVNVSDEQLYGMLKAETWITPEDAVTMGFATEIEEPEVEEGTVKNDAMQSIMNAVTAPKAKGHSMDLNLVLQDEQGALDAVKAFTAAVGKFDGLSELVAQAKAMLEQDPEILPKLKTALDKYTATKSTPAPAMVEDKGFFGFNRKGQN